MTDPVPLTYSSADLSGELCPILPTAIDPDALSVVRRLQHAGHVAYFVGGCVRDLLLGGTPKDFDIATSARPRQVKKLFRNSRIIGRRFRLVHVVFPGNHQIEVATFRCDPGDPPSDAAEPGPDGGGEFGEPVGSGEREDGDGPAADEEEAEEDLLIRDDNVYGTEAEDALRRDFTINGLFLDVRSGRVIDYVGGVADLRRRALRTIGEPARRVREDPVRILRAVKFAARLDLSLDPRLASAMAEYHEDLRRSAPPRVFEEILRILGGPAPDRAVEVLVGLGVLRVLFPELGELPHDDPADLRLARLMARLRAMAEIDRGRRSLPTALYVAVLFYDELTARLRAADARDGPAAPPRLLDDFLRPLGTRCRMAKRDTARLRAMMLALRRIDPELGEPPARRRRRRGGLAEFVRRENFADALARFEIACRADGRDLALVAEWQRRRDELEPIRGGSAREPAHERPGRRPDPDRGPDDARPAEGPPHRRRRRRRRRRGAAFFPPASAADLPPDDDSPA